jgi:hypothetical protein
MDDLILLEVLQTTHKLLALDVSSGETALAAFERSGWTCYVSAAASFTSDMRSKRCMCGYVTTAGDLDAAASWIELLWYSQSMGSVVASRLRRNSVLKQCTLVLMSLSSSCHARK